ncbi:MAG: Omp28-related outer membrane protein [Bacteroidia bacterium]
MKKILIFGCIASLFLLASCDKVNNPYKPQSTKTITGNNAVRKVLVEDYTGHLCGNCPTAGAESETLRQLYGNQVVCMELNVSASFAGPCPSPNPLPTGAPTGAYSVDYRSAVGTTYDNFFGISNNGLPQGMIDRFTVSGSKGLPTTAWATVVDSLTKAPILANITVTNTYNTSTRMLNTSLSSQFVSALSGTNTYKLVVLLVQDSIFDWQEDYATNPSDIPNYSKRFTLRDVINNAWGDTLATGNVSAGTTVVKSYTNYHINPAWNAATCHVISFIYETSDNFVLQAEDDRVE